ncbi:MAG TPA: peptidoglycan editing factor PgeF [Armatimonadota bacterium]|nr:peptidoglycan editing factor PgeF [Armatimonadota bacterium]
MIEFAIITESDKGQGAFNYETALDATDAMITNIPGICLMVLLADCTPILLYDPMQRAVAAAHAGWKGTAKQIGRKVVEAMRDSYGCRPEDIIAGIGPSIGPCCYEVGPEVISQFDADLVHDRNHLDLWEGNRRQLTEAGVRSIEVAGICTKCNHDRFFSERHTPGTGRFGAGIMLVA